MVGDPVQDGARLEALRVEVEVAADQRHQPLGVGGVVDREVRLVAELVDLLAQDPHARGVERRDPHDPGALADQLLDPLLHLGGGLVGEGDRQDRAGVGLALGDQPGDPAGQHAGLARAGAGHDEQRRPGVHDGRALGFVEAVEQLVGGGTAPGGAGLGRRDVLEAGDRDRAAHLSANPTCRHPRRTRRHDGDMTDIANVLVVGEGPVATALAPMVSAAGWKPLPATSHGRGRGAASATPTRWSCSATTRGSTGRRSRRRWSRARRTSARWARGRPRTRRREWLLANGVDEAALATVRAPIGLDIGADEPGEIAVSILAEIVAVRRGAGDDGRSGQ